MMLQARKLRVLVIDDSEIGDMDRDDLCINHIQTFEGVTGKLTSDGDDQGADIFLVDLNMENMRPPENLNWGIGGIASFGIILALPFLRAGRHAAFVPYSTYWDAPVASNGHVVVATALLLSASTCEQWTLEDTQRHIAAHDELPSATSAALTTGLTRYREGIGRLKAERRINVNRAIGRLETLLEILSKGGSVMRTLEDEEGPISIGISYPSGYIDNIQLASLFADELDKGNELSVASATLDQIVAILHCWEQGSINYGVGLLPAVVAILSAIDKAEEKDVRDIMHDHPELWEGWDRYQVLRSVMLVAWVIVAHSAEKEKPKPAGISQHRTKDKTDRERELGPIAQLYGLLGISEHGTVRYRRYLADGDTGYSAEPFRAPFQVAPKTIGDAWVLGRKPSEKAGVVWEERHNLQTWELCLCREYADRQLGWVDNPKTPYPVWLRREGE